MLERVYKQIDITPDFYPFIKSQSASRPAITRANFPSSQWESSAKSDYKVYFTPGPPAKFPDISVRDKERKNNPHAQYIHNELDKEGNKWTAQSTIYGEVNGPIPKTDYGEAFTKKKPSKPAKRSSWITRQSLPAGSIVPGYDYSEAVNDRVLPACGRDKSITLTTTPFLQYTGKKKPVAAPFHDGGVFYDTDPSSPRNAHVDRNYWHSVSSLGGKEFSRRKAVQGPQHSLTVDSFDGGVPVDGGPRVRAGGGVRTGYALAYSTMHRPE